MASRKPKAEDRTIDIFSGKTKLEEGQVGEVIESTNQGSETIEEAAERWRANAFYTQETWSKTHPEPTKPLLSKFRLTESGELMLLEKFTMDATGLGSSHWTGVMFKQDDLYELTSCLVRASKKRQEASGG
jgi:hypothetical protein